jgi:hypothetical protein
VKGTGFGLISVSPDGKRVYADGVYERDTSTGALTRLGPCACDDMVVSPDSRLALSVGGRGDVAEVDAVTDSGLEARPSVPVGEAEPFLGLSTAVAWSPDGRNAYLTFGTTEISPSPHNGPRQMIELTRGSSDDMSVLGVVTPVLPALGASDGLSINDGAVYTNTPTVTVAVPCGNSVALANDPSFADGALLRVGSAGVAQWTLRDTGLGRDVRRVYAVCIGSFDSNPAVPMDDIILDQRLPQILSAWLEPIVPTGAKARAARAVRTRLRIRAKDNRSGVQRLQVAPTRARPDPERKYRSSLVLSGRRRVLWVRIADGAGNYSRWRAVRVKATRP